MMLSAFCVCSCTSGQDAGNQSVRGDDRKGFDSLPAGKVIDSVACKSAPLNTYAVYLPAGYTSARKWPCVYFFDPHARGALPLNLYKDLADKYGFVFIGSNVSKNGIRMEQSGDAVKALMGDTRMRFSIDPRRIYAAGFSGGARVAAYQALLDTEISGVIGCGAGFQYQDAGGAHRFDFFGIAGALDFNLPEMEMLDDGLLRAGFRHQFLETAGKHAWPAAHDFETALLWLQVGAMKDKRQPKSSELVQALKKDFDDRAKAAEKAGDVVNAVILEDGEVRVLDGLCDVCEEKGQLIGLERNGFKKALTALQHRMIMEAAMEHELAGQYARQNEQWWRAKIGELERQAKSAPGSADAQMYQRVRNYLGLVGYMTSLSAINHGDMAGAVRYIAIFKMVDPENPDCAYLLALCEVKSGHAEEAISALNEAVKLGYNDVGQLLTEPAFASMRNSPAFTSLVSSARDNSARQ